MELPEVKQALPGQAEEKEAAAPTQPSLPEASLPEAPSPTPGTATSDETKDEKALEPKTCLFAYGRDIKSADDHHLFTAKEKERMSAINTLDYRLPNNQVQRHKVWTSGLRQWQKWLVFMFIGLAIGTVAFCLYQLISILDKKRLYIIQEDPPDYASNYTSTSHKAGSSDSYSSSDEETPYSMRAVKFVACSTGFGLIACLLVTLFAPAARGSGVPQVIAYMNGIQDTNIFSLRVIVIKFISCAFSVASGLPVGQEGPMIALGAAVGAGVGSGDLDCDGEKDDNSCSFFQYFQNSRDLRDFISGGVAAGVSAAFNAPVGGLLFTLEEVASFWSQRLSVMIFFCCLTATLWANLWKTAVYASSDYHDGTFVEAFGALSPKLMAFQVTKPDDWEEQFHILIVFPAIFVGIISGALGAVFTFINLTVARFRLDHINSRPVYCVLETFLVCFLFSLVSVVLPYAGKCMDYDEELYENMHTQVHHCDDGQYNDMASLTLNGGHYAINDLLARGTDGFYSVRTLFIWLVVYFIFAAYTAGMTPAVGSFVPMLYIGALLGRLVGHMFLDEPDEVWGGCGLIAIIGCAGFGAGLSRLTVALAVIIMEISGTVYELTPVMVAIMVAKWVADNMTHSLDHSILHLLAMPYLPPRPSDKTLQCFRVADIMAASNNDLKCLTLVPTIEQILHCLHESDHSGFPVVVFDKDDIPDRFHEAHGADIFTGMKKMASAMKKLKRMRQAKMKQDFSKGFLIGLITRSQLLQLLQSDILLRHNAWDAEKVQHVIEDYNFAQAMKGTLKTDHLTEEDRVKHLHLGPYVNTSIVTVSHTFEIEYAYELFRSLGLRHLVVTDSENHPVGMITRKDLLGQNIEAKLKPLQEKMGGGYKKSLKQH